MKWVVPIMKYPKRSQYKHAKQKKYHVCNWAEYNEGLRRRGDLAVWFDEEAIANWKADKTGKPGGQRVYSDMAIETGLVVRMVYKLGYPLDRSNTLRCTVRRDGRWRRFLLMFRARTPTLSPSFSTWPRSSNAESPDVCRRRPGAKTFPRKRFLWKTPTKAVENLWKEVGSLGTEPTIP